MPSVLDLPLGRFDHPADLVPNRSNARWKPAVAACAIVVSFALDKPVAMFLHARGIDDAVKYAGLVVHVIKFAGLFWYTLAVATFLCLMHPLRWRAGVFELLCAGVAGLNYLIKWITGRTRPFKLAPLTIAQPFHFAWLNGGWFGFMHEWDMSFVSGHVAVAFATAAGLDQLLPRHRIVVWLAYAAAIILTAERVLENAHWLSDTTCAAALGIGGAMLLARWLRSAHLMKNQRFL